jgi:hypothetical protein
MLRVKKGSSGHSARRFVCPDYKAHPPSRRWLDDATSTPDVIVPGTGVEPAFQETRRASRGADLPEKPASLLNPSYPSRPNDIHDDTALDAPSWQQRGNGNPDSPSLEVRARRAVGEWLQTFPWDIFAHPTFRADDVALHVAAERFELFVRRLARERVERHVRISWFVDLQRRGVPHFHVLLGTLEEDPRRVELADIDGLWVWGGLNAAPFDGRGATFYGATHHRFWDVNVGCPRPPKCRRPGKGCVHAPGPLPTPGELIL